MRIGIMHGASPHGDNSVGGMIEQAKRLESMGFDNLWMANIFSHDAITMAALMGVRTERIRLGTAVTPSFPRHPTAIAQQALTAAAACGNRFDLGIGLSHKVVIENMLGLSYDKPARHMREYLSILAPLARGETVSFQGEHYRVNNVTLRVEGADSLPVIVAALGPVMLRLAGELADGTSTWVTGPRTLETHIVPRITRAAERAGRPAPRIVAGLPVLLTDAADAARQKIGDGLRMYGQLPSYRAMLDREGAAGPGDVALVGNEAALRNEVERLRSIGVTDFNASITAVEGADSYDRTLAFLASLI